MAEDDNVRASEVSPITSEPAPPASAETLSTLEKLSQDYQPEVTGPLVGPLQSSKAIEEQYAGADQAFIRKTRALTPKYSHYRHVRGDGNCGWRALAFGYLELVLRSGDHSFVASERQRIAALNSVMQGVGYQEFLYEDFVEETIQVFAVISSALSCGGAYDDKPILDIFTNQEQSDAIVTHAKLLTSSWMKTTPDQYAPFLDTTVDDYCSKNVEPYGAEIDHISVNALIECLILPAGFAVEIFYLDRSEGEEVNIHRFEKPVEGKSKDDVPTIRLLYRPGHYDLIYKNGDMDKPPVSVKQDPSTFDMPPLTVGLAQTLEIDQTRAFCDIFSETGGRFKTMNISAQLDVPETLTELSWSETLPRTVLKKNPVIDEMPSNFRPSVFQFKAMQGVNFQPPSSQNSHNNTSHFQNENFQPEIYSP